MIINERLKLGKTCDITFHAAVNNADLIKSRFEQSCVEYESHTIYINKIIVFFPNSTKNVIEKYLNGRYH